MVVKDASFVYDVIVVIRFLLSCKECKNTKKGKSEVNDHLGGQRCQKRCRTQGADFLCWALGSIIPTTIYSVVISKKFQQEGLYVQRHKGCNFIHQIILWVYFMDKN